ncbi:MAG: branched-chain amino acid ABC transporter permease [Candidatus Eremiobacteraeota bacterium]|nr:branched-chain amino acid ABC transporter permease [Candidatus Eremiobacteraeota bacterium]
MHDLAQQIVSGLATGSIFASVALALVLIYRAMGIINFAQGELAMFTTYIAWQLTQTGMPMLLAFALAVLIAFIGGVALERIVVRPVERAPQLTVVIVTLGLFTVFNGLAGWFWGYVVKSFPTPFPTAPLNIAGVAFSAQDVGVIVVSLITLGLITVFFQKTKIGLAMRAAALYPEQSRVLGINVGWMLALGWGLASMVGAISGIMVAPSLFLDPNMMQSIVVYAFAAAVLGGIESPIGAVVGGLMLGVALNLLGTYVEAIGNELRLAAALAIIVVVLMVKPSGLFGRATVQRV